MAKVGDTGQIASMSIGVTVDEASLRNSLEQAKSIVAQANADMTIKPTIASPSTGGPVNIRPSGSGGGGVYQLDVTNGFIGAGRGEGYKLADEFTAAGDAADKANRQTGGFFSTFSRGLKEQAAPLRQFNQGVRQLQQAVFGLVGTVGSFVAAVGGMFTLGTKIGEFFAGTQRAVKDFDSALRDAVETLQSFQAARDRAVTGRLRAAGLSETQVSQFVSGVQSAETRALEARAEAERRRSSWQYRALQTVQFVSPVTMAFGYYSREEMRALEEEAAYRESIAASRRRALQGISERGTANLSAQRQPSFVMPRDAYVQSLLDANRMTR